MVPVFFESSVEILDKAERRSSSRQIGYTDKDENWFLNVSQRVLKLFAQFYLRSMLRNCFMISHFYIYTCRLGKQLPMNLFSLDFFKALLDFVPAKHCIGYFPLSDSRPIRCSHRQIVSQIYLEGLHFHFFLLFVFTGSRGVGGTNFTSVISLDLA